MASPLTVWSTTDDGYVAGATTGEYLDVYSADYAGTDRDPKLYVEYTEGAVVPNISHLLGIGRA